MSVSFEKAKKEYESWMIRQEYRETTKSRHRGYLDSFFEFVKSRKCEDIGDIKHKHLEQYQEWRSQVINRYGVQNGVKERNFEVATVNKMFEILNRLDLYVPVKPMVMASAKLPRLELPKEVVLTRDLVRVIKKVDLSRIMQLKTSIKRKRPLI